MLDNLDFLSPIASQSLNRRVESSLRCQRKSFLDSDSVFPQSLLVLFFEPFPLLFIIFLILFDAISRHLLQGCIWRREHLQNIIFAFDCFSRLYSLYRWDFLGNFYLFADWIFRISEAYDEFLTSLKIACLEMYYIGIRFFHDLECLIAQVR